MRHKAAVALILILAMILCGTPHAFTAEAEFAGGDPQPPAQEAPGAESPTPEDPEPEIPVQEDPVAEIPGPEAPGLEIPGPEISPADAVAALDMVFAMDDPVVLTIAYTGSGGPVESALTQSQVDAMTEGPYTYSNYNTFPSYGTNSAYGVNVDALLTAAGMDTGSLAGNRAVKFLSGDGSGYSSTLTWRQITEDRYFYSQNGTRGVKVPSIIGFSSDDPGEGNLPRNFFGQAAAGEQTRNSFVRSLSRIEVSGTAGTWGTASANPVSGTQIEAGNLIRLTAPSGAPAEAKIYYTLDGSEPTRASAMYNLVAQQWFVNIGITENDPIVVPEGSGTLVVRAKIMGLGMNDGAEVVFSYPYKATPDKPPLLNQAPPTGLTAGDMALNGTTTAMEYHTRANATSGWIRCAAGSTGVEPGTYYVRFAATETHYASPSVMLVVEEEEEKGETVISVYNGGRLAKAFKQADIDAMQKHGPNTYSGHNTWPTYETMSGVNGVRVMDLLSAAGVTGLASGHGIRFTSGDGFSSTATVGQLEEPRYFYSGGGARGAQTPSVINMAKGGDYRRLAFGQAAHGEQIRHALVKNVVRIDVQGGAGSWGSPTASPARDSTVKKGDPIRLAMPSGHGDAKIYYTLDGSEPTRGSTLCNPVADRWLFQKGMSENTPISAPGNGAFTIKAKIIGIGKSDGPTVSFSYNSQIPEQTDTAEIITPTLDELKSGGVVIVSGNSFFVPGARGSVSWNADEMDGYYDEELGGYVLTPKEGVEGTIWFTYTDENGVVHTLSIYVEPFGAEEPMSPEKAAAIAAASGIDGGGGSGAVPGAGAPDGAGGPGGLPLWLFIGICAVCAFVGAFFGPKLVRQMRARRPKMSA